MDEADSQPDPIDELVEEFMDRLRAGHKPTVEEYADKYPQHADRFRDLFATIRCLQDARTNRPHAQDSLIGRRLDDFTVVREIGRGGMGIVYEAVQASLGRQVALKVLAPDRARNKTLVERFRREARAVGGLHHTNIVTVFGVGEAHGIAYFAMQYIDGLGLDEVLRELRRLRSPHASESDRSNRDEAPAGDVAQMLWTETSENQTNHAWSLTFAQSDGLRHSESPRKDGTSSEATSPVVDRRIVQGIRHSLTDSGDARGAQPEYMRNVARIGAQVAEALAYAHRKGILHRDIKPSNLLLNRDGILWVTDFGLAKAEDSDQLTETGDIIGTLRYMAPERFQGQSLAQSDIYSLGLTLYEMLSLEVPEREVDRAGVVQGILHEPIVPLRQINAHVPRDLETIVLKAIAYRPSDRFSSADELAADLHRFLNDEPIRARPLGPVERLWRWCRRNQGVASLSTAVALTLLLGAGLSTYFAVQAEKRSREAVAERERAETNLQEATLQRQRAEASFREARKTVDEYYTAVSESKLLNVPGLQPLRKELLQAALDYFQNFVGQHDDDPAVKAEFAAAYSRVGALQSELGNPQAAFVAFERAVKLQESLLELRPNHAAFRRALADSYVRLGELERKSRLDAESSLNYFNKSLGIYQALQADDPTDPMSAHNLAVVRLNLAILLQDIGRFPDAEIETDKAELLGRQAVAGAPGDDKYRLTLSQVLYRKAELFGRLVVEKDRVPAAREATELAQRLAAESPSTIAYQVQLALNWSQLAVSLHQAKQMPEAMQSLAKSQRLFARLVEQNPDVVDYKLYRALTDGLSAGGNLMIGQFLLALKDLKNASAGIHELIDQVPEDPYLRLVLIYLYDSLSISKPDFALPTERYTEGIDILDKILKLPPGNPEYWGLRGICHARLGEWELAGADFGKAYETGRRDWPECLRLALLSYRNGDLQKYRKTCRDLLARIQDEDLSLASELMLYAVVLGPGAVDDYAPLIDIAKRSGPSPIRQPIIGALEYRSGLLKPAIERMEKARKSLSGAGQFPFVGKVDLIWARTINELFLCFAYRDNSQLAAAQESLKSADSLLADAEIILAQERKQQKGQLWELRAACECFRRDVNLLKIAQSSNLPQK